VGRFEMKQITKLLNFVRASLTDKKPGAQMNRARTKMVADLHHRSMVRVVPEEFNLAANYHPQDVTNSEYVRTYMSQIFPGGRLSLRLQAEKSRDQRAGRYVLPSLTKEVDAREIFSKMFDDLYGFRGNDARVYYLNPWEFVM
jgi:hypothetical protein